MKWTKHSPFTQASYESALSQAKNYHPGHQPARHQVGCYVTWREVHNVSHKLCWPICCIHVASLARPSPWGAEHGTYGTYHYQAYRSGWFVLLPKSDVLRLPRWSKLLWFGGCLGQRRIGSRNSTLLEVGSGGTTLEWQVSIVLLRQSTIVLSEET